MAEFAEGAEGGAEAGASRTVSPGRRLVAGHASRAAQSAARVALSETARSLDVAAFAASLSAEDRDRLRHEITVLLSRHGIVAGRIQIAARPLPPANA
jgi:hypothetical protein